MNSAQQKMYLAMFSSVPTNDPMVVMAPMAPMMIGMGIGTRRSPLPPMEEEYARAVCARLLHSPPAGCYASSILVLKEENNVGGSNVCMPLPLDVQQRVFDVTVKNFTGTIRQLSLGVTPEYQIRATGLFFSTGSLEVIGARSADAMRRFNQCLRDRLEEFGYSPRIVYLSLDNKVASGQLGFSVALERMHENLPGFDTTYLPDKFPGCICAYFDFVRAEFITFLVFEEGKVMALGIENIDAANRVFIRLVTMCEQFRVAPTSIRQRRKSLERVARLENEQQRGRKKGEFRDAKKIGKRVTEFLDANRSRMHDTAFQASLKRTIAELVRSATVETKTLPAAKRMAVEELLEYGDVDAF